MKIALNIEHLDINRGGAEKYVCELAGEMQRAGHEVHIFCRDGDISFLGSVILHIVPVIKCPDILSTISFVRNSAIEIKKMHFDIVHVFGKNVYMNLFQPLGGSHKASFIQNLRSIDNLLLKCLRFLTTLFNPKKLLFFYIEKLQVKDKKKLKFIAISKMVKNAFIGYYNFPADNISVIYNGINLQKFHTKNKSVYREKIRNQIGVDNDKVVLIFIANNFRLKGLNCAIKTLANLKKKVGGGYFKLLVVGRGKRKRFMKLIEKLNCIEDVIFTGPQEEIEKYLAASDICFQPSFYDPGSLVVLEALASGVPLVTTRFNGMGEIITNGQEGFVVDDPRDIEGLSNKILFLKEPSNLNRCSEAARILAEKYPLERNYREVLEVYRDIK